MPVTPTPPLVLLIEERGPPAPTAAEIRRLADFSQAGGIGRLLEALEWYAKAGPAPAPKIKLYTLEEEFADLVVNRFYEHVAKAKENGSPVRRFDLRQIILDCLP